MIRIGYRSEEYSNQNENLIKPHQENTQQRMNVNQFFIESENISSNNNKFILTFFAYRIIVPIFVIIFLSASIIPVVLIELKSDIQILSIILGVIISLLIIIFSNNKLEIIKDISNNKIIIKEINFLCFPKKIINIDLENFHFYFEKKQSYGQDGISPESIEITIINDYKNLVDIDLDKSAIKQKPAKFFYTYDNITNRTNAEDRYTLELNNFIGKSSENYENPLFFNINNYMNKNTNSRNFSYELSKYMKFSEHLFTYHFHSPKIFSCIGVILFVFSFISNLFVVPSIHIFLFVFQKLYGIYIFVVWNIILYIIYKCLKTCFDKIYRMDCIFSRDFDRIFIGLVKYNQKSYINTFEYEINNIDRFLLEKIGNKNYNLMVVFKDDQRLLICNIKKSKEDLEGLAFLLNERIFKNKGI